MHSKSAGPLSVPCEDGIYSLGSSGAIADNQSQNTASRRREWAPVPPKFTTGVLGKYARLVSSSSLGAVTDPVD